MTETTDWPEKAREVVEYRTCDGMKSNAAKSAQLEGAFWDAGAEVFIHEGVNGRRKDTLSAAEVEASESRAREEPGEDFARWLAPSEGA